MVENRKARLFNAFLHLFGFDFNDNKHFIFLVVQVAHFAQSKVQTRKCFDITTRTTELERLSC